MFKVPSGNALLNPERILKKVGIEKGQRVADLGCGGAGYFVLQAARMVGLNGEVLAVDVLKSALNSVESKARLIGLNNVKTVWSNLEVYKATQIDDNFLDAAFLFNTLFQSKKHNLIMKEAVRMIKPGGKLAVVDWQPHNVPIGPLPRDRVSKEEVKKLASQAGLKEISSFEAGDYHYGLVFTK